MSIKYAVYCTNWIDGQKYDFPLLADSKGLATDKHVIYFIKNPKLIKEVNSLEQFTFKIYPNHLNYSQLKIKESIIFALIVKFIVLLLGIFGISTIWMAVFADVGVTLLAILNVLTIMWKKVS